MTIPNLPYTQFEEATFPQVPYYDPEPVEERSSLAKYIDSINIAEELSEDRLRAIGNRCHEGYEADEKSREEWLETVERAIKLAKQQTEEKNFPWAGAANIKLPIILDACVKFAARASGEIIKDDRVVKVAIVGDDPENLKHDRSDRVGKYMSWQLTDKEEEWLPGTDKLLHSLPLVGHMFRKRYYCDSIKRITSEVCMPTELCVSMEATSLKTCRRYTHIIKNVTKNTIVGNQRAGIFIDAELMVQSGTEATDQADLLEESDYFTLLEQYCWLDLDEDGFEEPYIVTFEKESKQVLRIVARYDDEDVSVNDDNEIMGITPTSYFTEYVFIPSLDNTFYGIGFGQMLEALTRSANTLVNQLADSGSLNNLQAGYLSKEVKIKSGNDRFQLGEWKRTTATAEELRNGVFPLPTKDPSPVLFNLLSLIMDLTQDLASVKDVMSGDAPGTNTPATTVVALIEQGMKTFNAIYKRVYRAMTCEFKQLYELNKEYLDEQEYFIVLDVEEQVGPEDFESESYDIKPVADPVMSSDMQRLARAEALTAMIGTPGVNPRPIQQQRLEALKIPENLQAEILPEQDPNGLPPEVQAMIQEAESKMADIQLKEQELDLRERELDLKVKVDMLKAQGEFIKNIAQAEAAEAGSQLAGYKQQADDLLKAFDLEIKAKQTERVQNAKQQQ